MIGRAGLSSKCWRVLRWAGLAAAAPALWACTSRTLEMPQITPTATLTTKFTQKINNEIDLLFMIDNSSSMSEMQKKIYDQLPSFMQKLQGLPTPPSLHVAVVSSDMGAPGDSTTAIGCTPAGDQGQFQSSPRSNAKLNPPVTCTDSTIATPQGAADSFHTYITDADMMPNYTADIGTVFQCIALLGDAGCGFEHQLASIDRALGSDSFDGNGNPQPPSTNVGFLRPEAYLGIILLTNEDDCSASPGSTIYSLNGGSQNIANPDGPIANYRCNGGPRGAHLCQDPANGNAMIVPPLAPPGDVQMTGAIPTLNLTNCVDNETGSSALTEVTQFVNDVKRLKTDPDNQILVAAISAPPAPYAVEWLPESGGINTQPGEIWPQVEHSCGEAGDLATTFVNPMATQTPADGSFGDPGVRIAQFVNSFQNSVLASICDASYATSMNAIATKLGQLITPPCITGTIQQDAIGPADLLGRRAPDRHAEQQERHRDPELQRERQHAPLLDDDDRWDGRRADLQRLAAQRDGPPRDQQQLREQHGRLFDLPHGSCHLGLPLRCQQHGSRLPLIPTRLPAATSHDSRSSART